MCELSAPERMVFAYLLLNSKVNICGIYEIPQPKICFDTALSKEEVGKALEKLATDGKIRRHRAWVRIVNVGKYNNYRGPKNDEAFRKELLRCPRDLLDDHEITLLDTSIDTSMYTVPIGTRNQKLEIRNQKPIQIGKEFPQRWKFDSDEAFELAKQAYEAI